MSIGLINHHFPNKNALMAEAYRHFNSQLIGGIRAAVERAPDGAPRTVARPVQGARSRRPISIATCSLYGSCCGASSPLR